MTTTSLCCSRQPTPAKPVVPLLMQYGADVCVKDKCDGSKALHFLASTLHIEHHADVVTKILIEKGVSFEDRMRMSCSLNRYTWLPLRHRMNCLVASCTS
ncbi:hypothetical protein TSAR_002223 [Trichomalopsis sarcophagae]|uniref:Uncharacterized protein n=1 Tax=Trichomalopsis sarcophagae TaxID=543379 RepID=A0A232ELE7_9HYME|nr:hypothetical protein TSAR_002223 [Trichomalopsis sarcophagae]